MAHPDGLTRLCECHGEEMYWEKDNRKRAGGFWRCSMKWRATKALKNERRIRVGRMYVGYAAGFTKQETEVMLNGSSD